MLPTPPRRRRASAILVVCLIGLVAPAFRASAGVVAQGNGQGTLLIVGDSLMEGTAVFGSLRNKVKARDIWPAVTVDYKRGRTTVQGTRVLAQRLAGARNPTAIVVALGTNDMLSRARASNPAAIIDALMNESMGLPVLWVNVSFSRGHPDWRARAARFNRALLSARDDWPNLNVANWSGSFVPAGRSNYIMDGIHLSTSGYRTRAAWMDARIAEFGRRIVNASTTTTTEPSTTTDAPVTTTTTSPSTTTTVPVTTTT